MKWSVCPNFSQSRPHRLGPMCSGHYKQMQSMLTAKVTSVCVTPSLVAFWYAQELPWQNGLLALDNMKSRAVGCGTQGRASWEWRRWGESPLFTCWPYCFRCSPGCDWPPGPQADHDTFQNNNFSPNCSPTLQKPEIWLGRILSIVKQTGLASQRN